MQFYTLPHDSGEVLWYHVSCQCVRPSVCRTFFCPYFLSGGDNLKKCQWSFTKLGVCIDIVEIWFGIVNGKISSIFERVICPLQVSFFFFFFFFFLLFFFFFFFFVVVVFFFISG